jgi:hypothetical protein
MKIRVLQGVSPRDNHDELMEFIELRRLLHDAEVDHVVEASWLASLVRDVSKVLMDIGMPPSQRSPRICARPATSRRWWAASWST